MQLKKKIENQVVGRKNKRKANNKFPFFFFFYLEIHKLPEAQANIVYFPFLDSLNCLFAEFQSQLACNLL